MKHLLPIAALAIILSFVSCKNQNTNEEPWTGGPAIEVRFTNNALSANSKADPGKKPSDKFEKEVKSLVFLAYKENAAGTDVPKIKYVFTADECAKMRAVIPLGKDVTPGDKLEVYVIANCNTTFPDLGDKNQKNVPSLQNLKGYMETDRMTYNFVALADTSKGVNNAQGFAMAAFISKTTEVSGTGAPTKIDAQLNRTVARVDVETTITDEFFANYTDGEIKIISASLKFQAKQGTVVEAATKESIDASKANKAAPGDSLNQIATSAVVSIDSEPRHKITNFRYYPFSCGPRHASALDFFVTNGAKYDPMVHEHLLLSICAEFNFTGDKNNKKKIYYKIPLTGTDKVGEFLRNNYYKIDVKINGVTEQEIKATIEVADWLSVNTQNVNIGG